MHEKSNLSLALPNVKDIELVAVTGLEYLCKHFSIPDDKVGEAKIIVTEAIINALEHGGDSEPAAIVEFMVSSKKIVAEVSDFGKGFDPGSVEQPRLEKKLHAKNKRGWGLSLMKSMSDDLTIESNENGTKITMVKNLI